VGLLFSKCGIEKAKPSDNNNVGGVAHDTSHILVSSPLLVSFRGLPIPAYRCCQNGKIGRNLRERNSYLWKLTKKQFLANDEQVCSECLFLSEKTRQFLSRNKHILTKGVCRVLYAPPGTTDPQEREDDNPGDEHSSTSDDVDQIPPFNEANPAEGMCYQLNMKGQKVQNCLLPAITFAKRTRTIRSNKFGRKWKYRRRLDNNSRAYY
jgi:hypothetical protein